jgi:hypothetical protein
MSGEAERVIREDSDAPAEETYVPYMHVPMPGHSLLNVQGPLNDRALVYACMRHTSERQSALKSVKQILRKCAEVSVAQRWMSRRR